MWEHAASLTVHGMHLGHVPVVPFVFIKGDHCTALYLCLDTGSLPVALEGLATDTLITGMSPVCSGHG